ncbi:LysR substrate-binding domain-containing protein [Neptuniibacter pectenicola]|jgi:DNA-binding transcriptional LysR family regulator|uniref:LysR substrate-binding domain-containing protein n=1 Tax=Neptuniibacter pectenicola TaxID=1806669 RepID=UPI0007938AB9|nr:LysR substrate-binding domain-containing protein [Neptuniibacter pectenicola]KXJ57570.1 MAG: LysR family transcriptional regulator [Neptuniibacter sp. Phe_28]|tara:strand:+ start:296 stop:1168 length:873 start_codon:yes stop_codon:yes gene_type:complete
MYSWEGIAEFVAVAETESFTAASRQLSISTAQVSRQISALEKRLSTKLFYRTTRKVSITEAGGIYYQHCRQLLDGLDEAERVLTQLQNTPKGRLRLTAPTSFGESKIAPVLNDFSLLYPDLEIECLFTNQKIDLVDSGFDLAIRLGKLDDSSMMAKRLASRRLFVCASPTYLSDHGEPHLLAELEQHNCLQGTLQYWRFQENGQEQNIKIRGSLSFNSGPALVDAALKGLGLVQLPDYYVQEHLDSHTLIPLLQNYQPDDEGIWALYPQNRYVSPKVRMLIDYMSTHLAI